MLAALLLLGAGLLYTGVTLPAHRAEADAEAAVARARAERPGLRARLAARELQAAADKASAGVAAATSGPGDPVVRLRRSVVGSLEGATVSGARLAVTAGRPPVGARVQFSAEGRYAEILRLAGHLVRPGTGLVLESVRLRPGAAGLALDLSAFSLTERP
ncbi:MAG TPA: hypothetical protein VKI41_09525 [Vicinamibacteria bacterium]|nr:hypothetical protein [Vicinamibacteria bacterium]